MLRRLFLQRLLGPWLQYCGHACSSCPVASIPCQKVLFQGVHWSARCSLWRLVGRSALYIFHHSLRSRSTCDREAPCPVNGTPHRMVGLQESPCLHSSLARTVYPLPSL